MKHSSQNLKRTFLTMLLGVLISLGAFAQNVLVRGVVKDTKGEPIMGANVVEQGTTNGVITDVDGRFSITTKDGSSLRVSFIGFTPQTVKSNGSILSVVLIDDAIELKQAVVIGYGSVKKSDATGSVIAVEADALTKGAATNPADLLQGKTPGVQITNNGGAPGEGATIRIRGGSSMSASNDPLIVIDGLPISSSSVSGMSNALTSINPNDIETFTILKDASATAIYGSRASNGVILITTKKGLKDQTRPTITVDMSGQMSYLKDKLDVLSGDQLHDLLVKNYGEDHASVAALTSTVDEKGNRVYKTTDWQDEIYRTAFSQEYNVSVNGGVRSVGVLNQLPYRVSGGYVEQNGILKTSNMRRGTVSFNINPKFFNNTLSLNLTGKGVLVKNRFANTDAVGQALKFDPTKPVRTDVLGAGLNGYSAWMSSNTAYNTMATQNPVALLEQKADRSDVKRFIGNALIDYSLPFLPGLKANLNLGLDYSTSDGTVKVAEGTEQSWHDKVQNGNGLINNYTQTRRDQTLDFYLNYAKDLESIQSKVDVMAGYSWQHFYREEETIHTTNPSAEGAEASTLSSGTPFMKTQSYLVSFFGRVNYSLMDRYLATVTVRKDGSSKFDKNKWGVFPSVALAWRAINEPWLDPITDVVSDLKVRLGYGITGQQEITSSDYPAIPTYKYNTTGSYYMFGNSAIQPISPLGYDSELKWEETTTYNVGVDFGFLKNRITGSIDYYKRETKDLINYVPVSAGTNLTNYLTTNVGNLENEGVEFSINTIPVDTKDWTLEVGYNVSWNRNEITKLTASEDPSYIGVETGGISGGTGNNIQIYQVGQPTNAFYVYEQIYDENNRPIEGAYVDRNDDGVINSSDRYVYKKAAPDVFMGLNLSLRYKKLTLSASARANLNNYVYNNVASDGEMQSDLWTNSFISNRLTSSLNSNFTTAQYQSDYYVRNASFLKLDRVTLSYDIADWIKVYATAQNILTITDYDGLDPEVGNGIDNNMYPRPTTFILGASLKF